MVEVDVRGFSCPIPVIRTQKAIKENPNEELVVLVETGTSRENVSRAGRDKGYAVRIEEEDEEFRVYLTPPKR